MDKTFPPSKIQDILELIIANKINIYNFWELYKV